MPVFSQPVSQRDCDESFADLTVLVLAAITAVMYYLPHYILQKFIVYLENDPSRSDPSWGWLLAFTLFVSNALVFVVTGINWSITTTYLQGKIAVQLNSLLFAKTLVKKDVAGGGDKKDDSDQAEGEQEKSKGDDDEDEGVSSKSQIMVRSNPVAFVLGYREREADGLRICSQSMLIE